MARFVGEAKKASERTMLGRGSSPPPNSPKRAPRTEAEADARSLQTVESSAFAKKLFGGGEGRRERPKMPASAKPPPKK